MPLAIFSDCTAWFVSDLVGNPEDRFSHNEAHLSFTEINDHATYFPNGRHSLVLSKLIEPCSEKTGLRGFRPGPTQTGLCSRIR